MLPVKPYMVRAFYSCIVDQNLTPYLLVDTSVSGVDVPVELIENDRIILNLSPMAVVHLSLEDQQIEFDARFSGVNYSIVVPMDAIMAIYAKESGEGMMFDPNMGSKSSESPSVIKPKLTLVKS